MGRSRWSSGSGLCWGLDLSSGLRILLTLGLAGALLIVLMGPRWRGSFYRSWLRPRMLAFGILLAAFTAGFYVYRVVNALGNH